MVSVCLLERNFDAGPFFIYFFYLALQTFGFIYLPRLSEVVLCFICNVFFKCSVVSVCLFSSDFKQFFFKNITDECKSVNASIADRQTKEGNIYLHSNLNRHELGEKFALLGYKRVYTTTVSLLNLWSKPK